MLSDGSYLRAAGDTPVLVIADGCVFGFITLTWLLGALGPFLHHGICWSTSVKMYVQYNEIEICIV